VHDEIVAEVPANEAGRLDEFIAEMSNVPAWAEGLPVAVEGWEGLRFRK
jgi:DNA polymerase